MSTFPGAIPSFTNPTGSSYQDTVNHADQHSNANDEIEALAAKLGANGSMVQTSHDYKLSRVTGSQKAVSTGDIGSTVQAFDSDTTILGNSTTGSGDIVLSDSPVILTPTIASFTNAVHTHADADGGGQIPTAGHADASITARKLAGGWYAAEGNTTFLSGGGEATLITIPIVLEVTSDIAVKAFGSGNTNSADGTMTPRLKRGGVTKKTGTSIKMNAADREAAYAVGYTETSLAAGTYSMTLTLAASGDADAGLSYMEILVKAH